MDRLRFLAVMFAAAALLLPGRPAALTASRDPAFEVMQQLDSVPGDTATDVLLAAYLNRRVGNVDAPPSLRLPAPDDPRIDAAMLVAIALDADIDRRPEQPLPPDLIERLLAAAADNAWLAAKLIELGRIDDDLQRAALRAGAGAPTMRAPATALVDLAVARTLRLPATGGAVAVPPAVRGFAVGRRFAERTALRGDELLWLCENADPDTLADCARFARNLAAAEGLRDAMVGAALGDAVDGDACRHRRPLQWLSAMADEIDQIALDAAIAAREADPEGDVVAPTEAPQFVAIARRDGELAALRWKLAAHDVPVAPPPGWRPEDPAVDHALEFGCL